VEAGDTEIVPAAANPLPTPWSICMLVASVAFQISVVDSPAVIAVSEAENATMVGASPDVVVVLVVLVEKGQQERELSISALITSTSQASESSFFICTSEHSLRD
jgi:hypothetical protein